MPQGSVDLRAELGSGSLWPRDLHFPGAVWLPRVSIQPDKPRGGWKNQICQGLGIYKTLHKYKVLLCHFRNKTLH